MLFLGLFIVVNKKRNFAIITCLTVCCLHNLYDYTVCIVSYIMLIDCN